MEKMKKEAVERWKSLQLYYDFSYKQKSDQVKEQLKEESPDRANVMDFKICWMLSDKI